MIMTGGRPAELILAEIIPNASCQRAPNPVLSNASNATYNSMGQVHPVALLGRHGLDSRLLLNHVSGI